MSLIKSYVKQKSLEMPQFYATIPNVSR